MSRIRFVHQVTWQGSDAPIKGQYEVEFSCGHPLYVTRRESVGYLSGGWGWCQECTNENSDENDNISILKRN
jgi:hypothetical protein